MKVILKSRCQGKRMSRHYFLNPDHTYSPCDLLTWARQFESENRQVADDEINGYRVSTVWLGTDHNYGAGHPLVFETMIFNPAGKDNYLVRYTTWDQAVAGHQKAIDWVKNGCKEDNE
jgi:hypothetical protein